MNGGWVDGAVGWGGAGRRSYIAGAAVVGTEG
jgi:hypothetical protein